MLTKVFGIGMHFVTAVYSSIIIGHTRLFQTICLVWKCKTSIYLDILMFFRNTDLYCYVNACCVLSYSVYSIRDIILYFYFGSMNWMYNCFVISINYIHVI